MAKYFSRDDAIKTFMKMQYYDENGFAIDDADEKRPIVEDWVDCIPISDVQPVRHGHWKKIKEDYDIDDPLVGRCSACGWFAGMYEEDVVGMNYCPNCGARMEEDDAEIH